MDSVAIVNLVLFGILFLSTFIGFAKGFLEQAIELVGAIGSFILAIMMAGSLARFLESRFDAPYSVFLVIAFVILLVAGLGLTHVLAMAVGRVIKMTILKLVDRFTGAVLGLIMGMIIGSLLITATLELPFPDSFRREVAKSSMALFLRPIAGQVYNWVTDRTSAGRSFEDIFKEGNKV